MLMKNIPVARSALRRLDCRRRGPALPPRSFAAVQVDHQTGAAPKAQPPRPAASTFPGTPRRTSALSPKGVWVTTRAPRAGGTLRAAARRRLCAHAKYEYGVERQGAEARHDTRLQSVAEVFRNVETSGARQGVPVQAVDRRSTLQIMSLRIARHAPSARRPTRMI